MLTVEARSRRQYLRRLLTSIFFLGQAGHGQNESFISSLVSLSIDLQVVIRLYVVLDPERHLAKAVILAFLVLGHRQLSVVIEVIVVF